MYYQSNQSPKHMKVSDKSNDRRWFLQTSTSIALGITSMSFITRMTWPHDLNQDDKRFIIGPRVGYTPQLGTLVSMLDSMSAKVINTTRGLTIEQLDYLLDEKANTIGAMLLHLAATEKYYQLHTFNNMEWGSWDATIKEKWDAAMSLGEEARKNIKGNNYEYYVNILNEVRSQTHEEFKKRDDKWLMEVDNDWSWGSPANNYFKWFHVCEHESHHIGQINLIKGRLPS